MNKPIKLSANPSLRSSLQNLTRKIELKHDELNLPAKYVLRLENSILRGKPLDVKDLQKEWEAEKKEIEASRIEKNKKISETMKVVGKAKRKWTPEKIAELKRQQTVKVHIRTQVKKSAILSLQPTISHDRSNSEIKKFKNLHDQLEKSNKEKEREEKELLKRKIYENNCKHIFKFSYFLENGMCAVTCKNCSSMDIWDPKIWRMYVADNRAML